MSFPKISANFLADDNSSHCRGNDRITLHINKFRREVRTDFRSGLRVLQHQRALKILPAVQPGTEDKMALQQRVSLFKYLQYRSSHVSLKGFYRNCLDL